MKKIFILGLILISFSSLADTCTQAYDDIYKAKADYFAYNVILKEYKAVVRSKRNQNDSGWFNDLLVPDAQLEVHEKDLVIGAQRRDHKKAIVSTYVELYSTCMLRIYRIDISSEEIEEGLDPQMLIDLTSQRLHELRKIDSVN